MKPSLDTGALAPDARIRLLSDLALFLWGSEDSFTGFLLYLIAKADLFNLARLRIAFPETVAAYEAWQRCDPAPTAAELRNAIDHPPDID